MRRIAGADSASMAQPPQPPPVRSRGIHGPDAFRAVIQRERERCNRNAHRFSVVSFDVGGNGDRPVRTQVLIRLLQSRCRLVDDIGRLDTTRVGVLLPNTTADGARTLADHVRQALTLPNPSPSCEVFTYPPGAASDACERVAGKPPGHAAVPAKGASGANETANADKQGIETIMDVPCPAWKRTMDLVGSLTAVLIFSPVMIAIAIYIKIVSPGPLLFRQERIGYLGRRFVCWKFRTMKDNNDTSPHRRHMKQLMRQDAPLTKLDVHNDCRIIPLGFLLRQTGLDELPQLFNVLRGDMSLVGPRPCIPYEHEEFLHWQRMRVDARPGLTGLWQVSGKNRTTFTEMLRLDIRYARQMSPAMDLRIMAKTFGALGTQVRDGWRHRRAARAARKTPSAGPDTVDGPHQAETACFPIFAESRMWESLCNPPNRFHTRRH